MVRAAVPRTPAKRPSRRSLEAKLLRPPVVGGATTQTQWLPLFQDFINHLTIESKETGQTILGHNLWGSQRRALVSLADGMDRGIRDHIYLKSRQLGETTLFLGVDLFWLFLHPGINGVFVVDDEGNRDKFRVVLRQYAKSLPKGMSYPIVDDNKTLMSFNVGGKLSILDFLVAGKRRGTLGASRSYRFAHLSEVANYGDEGGLENFLQTLSENHPDRLFIKESTANGFNHFHTMCQQAKNDKLSQQFTFIGWWARDDQRIWRSDPRFDHYMKDQPWTDEELEQQEEVAKNYGVLVDDEQLAWYRMRATSRSLDEGMLKQTQPWCLTADVRVGTGRGLIPIAEARVGDTATMCEVLASGPTGVAPIWRAMTSLGYEVTGTANHPIIASDEREIELSKSLGEEVKLLSPRFADDPFIFKWKEGVIDHAIEITPDLARLVGLFMGDGSLGIPSSRVGAWFQITCSGVDLDVVDECHRLINILFGLSPQNRIVPGKNGGYIAVRISSRLVCDTFRSLGLTRNDPATKRKVHVPEFIFRSPKHIVKEFLRGLFEADGFNAFKTHRVALGSMYPAFLQDIQLLLLGFGITCAVRHGVVQRIIRGKLGSYNKHQIELRASEARKFNDEIGFISARKRARMIKPTPVHPEKITKRQASPILLCDRIVSVEDTGRIEPVYNLSVSGSHLFDANGIVTHNTEREAFIISGRSFFPLRKVEKDIAHVYENPKQYEFKAYRYYLGQSIDTTTIEQVFEVGDAELKVWEEPVPWGRYVIGCDPAYGRSDWNDSHAICVCRCYADRLVVVAEYGSTEPETFQVTWALAHLASMYEDCYVNLEVRGPGMAIMTEMRRMKQILQSTPMNEIVKTKSWDKVLDGVKWYLWHRPDSLGKGYAYGINTTVDLKIAMMNEVRDSYTNGMIDVRSIRALEQMQYIVQEGAEIGPAAKGRKHDDFVFSLTFAHRAWLDWVRPDLIAEGYTYESAQQDDYQRINGERPGFVSALVSQWFDNKEKERLDGQNNSWEQQRGFR